MPVNLVSLITRFLTPDIVGRIASLLGLDHSGTQTAISAAIPSLLAGLSGVAAQSGGPQKLADVAAQQSGALDGFKSMLTEGNPSSFIERGSRMLSSLLGAQDQNALAGTIGKFAGVGQGATGSLLGMLAPVVMGTIAQQQRATGSLEPSGIAGLLASQKDNITAALPSGFAHMLSGTGLLDSLGGAARTAAAAGSEAARASASAASDVVATAPSNNWFYWFIPAAAVAALLLYLFARPAERVAEDSVTPATTGQGTTGVQTAMVGGVAVDKELTDSINSLRTTLAGVTDAASAEAALPKLQQAAAQIDKVNDLSVQLSPEQRKTIARLVNPAMPTLSRMFDKVTALPGVSAELKLIVESLKAKLSSLGA